MVKPTPTATTVKKIGASSIFSLSSSASSYVMGGGFLVVELELEDMGSFAWSYEARTLQRVPYSCQTVIEGMVKKGS